MKTIKVVRLCLVIFVAVLLFGINEVTQAEPVSVASAKHVADVFIKAHEVKWEREPSSIPSSIAGRGTTGVFQISNVKAVTGKSGGPVAATTGVWGMPGSLEIEFM